MRKNVIKSAAAAALAALMTVSAAAAAVFPDTQTHWAQSYIADMNVRGIIQGYTDGNFRPDESVKTVELLVMLARMCELDSDTKTLIYNDYKDNLTKTFGTELSWAHESFAICIEGNIITESELTALFNAGSLGKAAAKELLSVFLVRAMGLEQKAKDSASAALTFADADSVSALRRPYVYVLSNIGIVQGNTKNQFEPKSDVTRAVTATMISRALSYMEENGVSVDFSKYQNEKRVNGIISDIKIENNQLSFSVKNELSGTQTATVSTDCKFYYDGISTDISAISDGKYVMILYKNDQAQEVQICSSYRTISGIVLSSNAKKLEIRSAATGTSSMFDVNDYTQAVIDGGTVGGGSVVNKAKRFCEVTCAVNTQKQVLYAKFSSEAQTEQGMLKDISVSGNVRTAALCHANGFRERITLSNDIYTLVDGTAATLSDSYENKLATIVYSSNKSKILAVDVDAATTIYDGTLKNIMTDATPKVIYITGTDGKVNGYNIVTDESELEVKYNGSAATMYNLTANTYIFAKSSSNKITGIYSYPTEASVSGEVSSVTYGDQIILKILSDDNREINFALDASKLPTITRGGSASAIDKLRSRDKVTVTQKNGKITLIAAGTQEADATGVITSLTMEISGNVLSYKDAKDGSVYSYTIADGADVKKDGKSINISDLKVGYTVALVTGDEKIYSIEVTQTSSATSGISGKVLYINSSENTALIETSDGAQITVKIPSSASVVSASDGMALTFKNLKIQDVLTVYGAYDGTQFKATLVIR